MSIIKKILVCSFFIFCLLFLSTVSAVSPEVRDPPDTWGKVLYCNAAPGYHYVHREEKIWYGIPFFVVDAFAIGRHEVTMKVEYDLYVRSGDGLEHKTGVFDKETMMYMFDFTKRPMFNMRMYCLLEKEFYMFDHGEWWSYLYIDGELYHEGYFKQDSWKP